MAGVFPSEFPLVYLYTFWSDESSRHQNAEKITMIETGKPVGAATGWLTQYDVRVTLSDEAIYEWNGAPTMKK